MRENDGTSYKMDKLSIQRLRDILLPVGIEASSPQNKIKSTINNEHQIFVMKGDKLVDRFKGSISSIMVFLRLCHSGKC